MAHTYVDAYEAAYNRLAGTDGRAFQEILKSASDADATYLEDLRLGGGETSDLAELQRAVGNKDVDAIKAVLRKQPNRGAIDALVAQYNKVFDRDLHRELFGQLYGQELAGEAAETAAEDAEKTKWTGGLVVGRDAAQIAEMLGRPAAARPGEARSAGESVYGAGYDEVSWMVGGGQREFDVTMSHRGATGHMREWTGDPETERILKRSRENLHDLQQQWEKATAPAEKHHLMLEIRKARAALSLDADAYEKDNERVLGEIRAALSFAVSIALAIALPGAGAGLAAFLESTALQIAANVAANVVIKGDDYSWADLKADLIGGAMGAGGAKFGEELLGRVAVRIAGPAAKATAGATERVGIETALAKEVGDLTATGEKVAVSVEEMEAKAAGREVGAATNETAGEVKAATKEAGAESGAAAKDGRGRAEPGAAPERLRPRPTTWRPKSLAERGAREVGGFFGGIFGGKLYSGDMSLSLDEVLQALAATLAGKAAHHEPAAGHGEGQRPALRPRGRRQVRRSSGRGAGSAIRRGAAEEEGRGGAGQDRRRGGNRPKGVGGPALPGRGDPDAGGGAGHSPDDRGHAGRARHPGQERRGIPGRRQRYDAIVKVRPTNVASIPVLEQGGVAKPELIKAKTVNKADLLLGAPKDGIGKVGFFDPVLPSTEILEVMRADERQQLLDRFAQRREEFRHYREEYGKLEAEGLIRVKDGIVQIAIRPPPPARRLRTASSRTSAGTTTCTRSPTATGTPCRRPGAVSWSRASAVTRGERQPPRPRELEDRQPDDPRPAGRCRDPRQARDRRTTGRLHPEVHPARGVRRGSASPAPSAPLDRQIRTGRPPGPRFTSRSPAILATSRPGPAAATATGGSGHRRFRPRGPRWGRRGSPTEATSSRRGGGDQRQRHPIRQGGGPREGRGAVSVRGPEQQPRSQPSGPGPDGGSVRPGGSPGSRQRRRHQGRPADRRGRRGCEATQPGPEHQQRGEERHRSAPPGSSSTRPICG